MGNRFRRERYDRPGSGSGRRNKFIWPYNRGHETKVEIGRGDRDGETVKYGWDDCFASRRDNNRVRRAADRAAIRHGLLDIESAD